MKEMEMLSEEIKNCKGCILHRNRENTVVGEGNLNAEIMFIGEAPGYYEDKKGRPFVGAAGRVLNSLLSSVGLKREEIYITNLVKCRPPENRNPTREEIRSCSRFLNAQIDLIDPEIICTLGNLSTDFILDRFGVFVQPQYRKMRYLHGREFAAKKGEKYIKIVPFYHPAVAVYRNEMRDVLERDFKQFFQKIRKGNSQ